MNYPLYKKLLFAIVIISSLTLSSCGSGGGGSEEVFAFKSTDLANKYWYANPYLSPDYNRDDALIVYRFEGGGVLKKQDFSGRRDEVVGSWSLSDNELVIEDESISATNRQEWFVQSKSTSNYLKLNSNTGTREFFTNINDLNDVSADAYVVNEVRLVNNAYESAYRMEYAVYGEKLSQVKVLPDANTSIQLEDFQNYQGQKIYLLPEKDRTDYFNQFTGGQKVKFYLKTEGGENYKLEDQLYESDIDALDNFSITATHASGSVKLTVNWKAVDEADIYYYVEILDKNANEYLPKFRSTRQPATAGEDKTLAIDNSVANELNLLNELPVGEDYYVKITGFKYEDGIDANNSSNKEMNIQAMTRFVFKAGQW
ncbi:hypothetical protein [Ancylomarina longa]|uniref:Lipoprotein n=1 Tax=Ancylomarina longa TaxID=2487017 RepID=A0A434AFW1_9BACT|nr:hypothetical protein [Ancylomarina longa]RUT73205.1 hypothetical protein DLK05_14625 [Ancylomarina longa]